jgi:predicted transcriptional regulator
LKLKQSIFFGSIGSFCNFLTIQKLEVLTWIANGKPKSICELAKMLNRVIAAVQKESQSLEVVGFITFEKERGGRKTLTTRLAYSYNYILV